MKKTMMTLTLLVFTMTAAPTAPADPPAGPGYSWKIIFEDNFDGTALNTNKWMTQIPWTRTHKGDAYDRAENLTVADGLLTITAKAENFGGKAFTSGAVSTGYSKFRFKYGYAEARIKMPSARGSWCNFWMLSDGWPPEIDICEFPLDSVSGDNNQLYRYISNIHYTANGSNQSSMDTHWRSNLSAGFHTYALDWRPWYVAYYFDDGYVRSLNDFEPSNHFGNMYMILNYYVGGDWGGQVWQHPDPATWPDPADGDAGKMQIDWVRVWQRSRDTVTECIGRWALDETAGTTAADGSGNGMHGTLHGFSFDNAAAPGIIGSSLAFDGVDDYIDLPDGFDEFDNGMTVTLWAKPTAVKNYARFIDLGGGEYDNNIYLARSGTSDDLVFKVFGGSTSDGAVVAPDAIELDTWQFFAATIDTAGRVVLYKNGRPVRTGTSTWPWGVRRTRNYIGRSNWSYNDYYQGLMDDVRIFDYALAADQVKALYAVGDPCTEPYPQEYDFNGDCRIDLADIVLFSEFWLSNGLYAP